MFNGNFHFKLKLNIRYKTHFVSLDCTPFLLALITFLILVGVRSASADEYEMEFKDFVSGVWGYESSGYMYSDSPSIPIVDLNSTTHYSPYTAWSLEAVKHSAEVATGIVYDSVNKADYIIPYSDIDHFSLWLDFDDSLPEGVYYIPLGFSWVSYYPDSALYTDYEYTYGSTTAYLNGNQGVWKNSSGNTLDYQFYASVYAGSSSETDYFKRFDMQWFGSVYTVGVNSWYALHNTVPDTVYYSTVSGSWQTNSLINRAEGVLSCVDSSGNTYYCNIKAFPYGDSLMMYLVIDSGFVRCNGYRLCIDLFSDCLDWHWLKVYDGDVKLVSGSSSGALSVNTDDIEDLLSDMLDALYIEADDVSEINDNVDSISTKITNLYSYVSNMYTIWNQSTLPFIIVDPYAQEFLDSFPQSANPMSIEFVLWKYGSLLQSVESTLEDIDSQAYDIESDVSLLIQTADSILAQDTAIRNQISNLASTQANILSHVDSIDSNVDEVLTTLDSMDSNISSILSLLGNMGSSGQDVWSVDAMTWITPIAYDSTQFTNSFSTSVSAINGISQNAYDNLPIFKYMCYFGGMIACVVALFYAFRKK